MKRIEPMNASEVLHGDARIEVYPSEVMAAQARRRSVDADSTTASNYYPTIREDRFVSWDAFKERYFPRSARERPANRLIRSLFLERLFQEEGSGQSGQKGPLSRLLPTEYIDAITVPGGLLRLLPKLPSILTNAPRSAPMYADLAYLDGRYERFLGEHGLFEPAHNADAALQLPRVVIYYPELIEDWPEFGTSVIKAGAELLPLVPANDVPLHEHDNTHNEISSCLDRIAGLLDYGVPPSDIVVTIAPYESLAARFAAEARVRDVPLALRSGTGLDEYAVGRFIRSLESLGTDLTAMRRAVLDRAVPWRDRDTVARLVAIGVRYGCRRTTDTYDGWRHAILQASTDREDARGLRRLLRRITRAATAVGTSSSFAEVRSHLYAFTSQFLDSEAWSSVDKAVFQRSASLLGDLIQTELSLGITARRPWAFYLNALNERRYVVQHAGDAVAVFPYRVAAGIDVPYHFVLGLSDAATRVRSEAPLPEYEADALGLEPRDQSAAFLAAYSRPGCRLSYSRRSPDGAAVPPPGLTPAADPDFNGAGGAARDHVRLPDPIRAEEAMFAGLCTGPTALGPTLRASAERWARKGPHRIGTHGRGITGDWVSKALEKDGRLLVTPTRLERGLSCGLSLLYENVLALEDEEFDPVDESPRDEGSLYHQVLERLFARIRDEDGRFRAVHCPDYLAWASETIVAEITKRRPRGAVVSEFEKAYLPARLLPAIAELLSWDAKAHGDFAVVGLESTFETSQGTALLHGRVDRILADKDGSLALVDFKRSGRSVKRARFDPELPVEDRSHQIPFYLILASAEGSEVSEAAYFILSEGKASAVVGGPKAWLGDKVAVDEAVAATRKAVEVFENRVRSGDFSSTDDKRACRLCSFRPVCRSCYATG